MSEFEPNRFERVVEDPNPEITKTEIMVFMAELGMLRAFDPDDVNGDAQKELKTEGGENLMAERDQILGSVNENSSINSDRSVTVLPDGKVLIGVDATFHPKIGVAGDGRINPQGFGERPRRTY